MKLLKVFALVMAFAVVLSCNKSEKNVSAPPEKSSFEEPGYSDETKLTETRFNLTEKLNEYAEKEFARRGEFPRNEITAYKDNYLYFYGKTKEDIIEKYGDGFEITGSDSRADYEPVETMEYPGLRFDVFVYSTGSRVLAYEISRADENYYGDIAIGCDLGVIINQLGKPNQKSERDNIMHYDVAGNFQMYFYIDENYKLEKISVYEDLM
jgi:hypothetical protein